MVRSREAKIQHFYSLCKEGMSVLDVGVSNKSPSLLSPSNHFLKTYRYPSTTYTGLGIQDIVSLEKTHPGKRFIRYDGKIFPFTNDEFDFAFSNAVIEHVGGTEAQLLFVNEMLRACKIIFFTTPNKFFPIETHKNLLFIHWNDAAMQGWIAKNNPRWNLNLLSYSSLSRLMERSDASSYTIYRNRFFGWTMTFTIVAKKEGPFS